MWHAACAFAGMMKPAKSPHLPSRSGVGETVLFVDSRDIGGIETHILILAEALSDQGLPVRVLFLKDHGNHPLIPMLDAARIDWSAADGTVAGLMRALKRSRVRVLHTHGYKAGIYGRLAGWLLGLPVVSTFHSGDRGRGKLRLYTWLDRVTAGYGRNIAVSREIQQDLPPDTALIANFVKLPALPERSFAAGRQIAFVGRLSYEKGPDLFCRLAASMPDHDWVVYGDGPMRAELQEQFPSIRFVGRVAGMDNHWADIGLLVMPSRAEGLPLAALEALAHGVPVAAFAVGGLPDLIGKHRVGWIAPDGELDQLGEVVKRWSRLGVNERHQIGLAARALIAREYSVIARVGQILAVYGRVADRAGVRLASRASWWPSRKDLGRR
jgi:glycosyltransferase involved in cell wall biosynthesis